LRVSAAEDIAFSSAETLKKQPMSYRPGDMIFLCGPLGDCCIYMLYEDCGRTLYTDYWCAAHFHVMTAYNSMFNVNPVKSV
jgi:hypothetical protein